MYNLSGTIMYAGGNMKKLGDRKDGTLIKGLDSMHLVTPLIYPNRTDNETYFSEIIDLTKTNKYLETKMKSNPEYKYNLFQVIVTSMLKMITLRPATNRFIANGNIYQRNEVTASFVVKKVFSDKGEEALAVIHSVPEDNIDTIHEKIYKVVSSSRSDKKDSSTDLMDKITNVLPRFLLKIVAKVVCWLDVHGWVPQSLIETDPYYCSVVLSNLGSLGLHSIYHHLTNWGTTSIFITIGKIEKRPFYDENGNVEMRDSVDVGITVDERIADGFYFSKSVALLKQFIENPELLEVPLNQEVEKNKS